MPYRKSYKRFRPYHRNRRMKKFRRGGNFIQKYPRPTSMSTKRLIVPDRAFIKLRWNNILTPSIATSVSNFNYYQWRINGLYDIDPAIGSEDVAGFSSWGSFYGEYRVNACKVKIRFTNLDNVPKYVGFAFLPENNALPSTWADYKDMMANSYVTHTTLEQDGSRTSKLLSMYCDLGKLVGDINLYRSNLNYRGTTAGSLLGGANPGIQLLLHAFAMGYSSTVALPTVTPLDISAVFYTEFFGRILNYS